MTSRTPRLHNKQEVPHPTRSAIGSAIRFRTSPDIRMKFYWCIMLFGCKHCPDVICHTQTMTICETRQESFQTNDLIDSSLLISPTIRPTTYSSGLQGAIPYKAGKMIHSHTVVDFKEKSCIKLVRWYIKKTTRTAFFYNTDFQCLCLKLYQWSLYPHNAMCIDHHENTTSVVCGHVEKWEKQHTK